MSEAAEWLKERLKNFSTSDLLDFMRPEDSNGDCHADDCQCPGCLIWRAVQKRHSNREAEMTSLKAQLGVMDAEISALRLQLETVQANSKRGAKAAREFEALADARARECDSLSQQLRIANQKLVTQQRKET